MKATLTAQDMLHILEKMATDLEGAQDLLRDLDAAMGDGDHGVTMKLGFGGIRKALPELEQQDIGTIIGRAGMIFNSAAASTIGVLLASACLRAGREVKGKTEIDLADVARMANAGVQGVRERGKAEVGNKTMLDTLVPWANALVKAESEGRSLPEGLSEAEEAAKQGMLGTKDLMSKVGRGSWLGERTIGLQDPGATSTYLMIRSLTEYVSTSQ